MTLELLKATVARTRTIPVGDDEPRLGTAFLVSRRLLLTCAHCLGSQGRAASEVELQFSRWAPAAKPPTAKVVHANWDLDVALLDLGEEAPVDPLPLTGRGTNGDSWESFGHPLQVGTDGIKFSGKVADARALSYGKDAMHLHCQEAADRVHGASGSPVMIDGQIAGIFTKQLLEYASGGVPGELKPAFQAVYALPIDALASDPELASRLQWGPMARAELIVETARERARAATMKRIISDAKYREDRYVERESVRESFEAFMAQEEHKCYLVVGKAGAGKTTTMAHLALNSTRGPALFFRGGIDGYSVDDIRQLVTSALFDADGDAGAGPRHWDELIDALRSYGAPLVLFIDAINEVTFTDIPLRRNEIQLLLEFIADLPLRVVVSCRDVFWTYFIDPRGQDRDFWWQYVYDATYPGRLQAYTDQLMRDAQEAAQKAAPGASVELKPKEIQMIREAAVQRVEHRPSLLLGDFTPDELA
ncbi:MAG: trypsin-like peptidase domain-containing protein, partial [Thermoanaerobaculia bacterium]